MQFKSILSFVSCIQLPIAVETHWLLSAERYRHLSRRTENIVSFEHSLIPLFYLSARASESEGFTTAILNFGRKKRPQIGEYKQEPHTVTKFVKIEEHLNGARTKPS